jgi:hypothetical protein
MTKSDKEKIEKILDDDFRKKGQPVNINRLIEISKVLDELEAQEEEDIQKVLKLVHAT